MSQELILKKVVANFDKNNNTLQNTTVRQGYVSPSPLTKRTHRVRQGRRGPHHAGTNHTHRVRLGDVGPTPLAKRSHKVRQGRRGPHHAGTRCGRADVGPTTLARNTPAGSGRVDCGLINGMSFR